MERKTFSQLPLGVSDFHKLRELEKIYVDKTGLLYELITTFEKVFLARPRRFGKSLLVSTFESLFKYGTRDFKRKISPWLGYNSPTTGHSSLSKGLRAASGES